MKLSNRDKDARGDLISPDVIRAYCISYADNIASKEDEFINTLRASISAGQITLTFARECLARTRISLLTVSNNNLF